MISQLNTRDGYAIILAAGIKIGGGSWSQALLWGMGARLAMKYAGFPEAVPLQSPAQSLLEAAGQVFKSVFGTAPSSAQPGAPPTGDPNQQPIDAEYTEYGTTQTQGP